MFEELLAPVDPGLLLQGHRVLDNHIFHHMAIHTEAGFPNWEEAQLALIGVVDDRGAVENTGCAAGPDKVREYLYRLDKGTHPLKMVDLGNILPGAALTDTYAALGQIVSELIPKSIIPIILGGSHDLTYGQYLGYARNDQVINMTVVDETINIYKQQDQIDAASFLYRIFTETPNYLFNFSQIGYQSYFVSPDDIATLEQLYFEFYRLGKIREDLEEVEPIIRDADMLSFDIAAIKQSDAPGKKNATPHGFYGEEACKIARYAGITDKLSSIGFYEYNPAYDNNDQTAQVIAHMIWYFIDGYYSRTNEYPIVNDQDFLKYTVEMEDAGYSIIFWKSKRSGRWWMQVPSHEDKKYERHQLVPCSYADYEEAMKAEIPARWMQAFEKLA